MLNKYSKPYGNLMHIKKSFYEDNDELLENQLRNIKKYKEQPLRKICKLCGEKSLCIDEQNIFVSHGASYWLCDNCGHVNGMHQDTEEFSNYIYCDSNYESVYSEKSQKEYFERVRTIYVPKIDFLLESMEYIKENEKIRVLDIGAGSGFFCAAGIEKNIDIIGVEISCDQVEYGNKMMNGEVLHLIENGKLADCIKETDRNTISAIGVLEHLFDLENVLNAIHENKNIKYLFLSVPMFSFTVYMEMLTEKCFHRQLGGAHNHLFTTESIEYMCKKYCFEPVSVWRFGTDIMDMYRMMRIGLRKQGENIVKRFDERFLKCSEDLQKVIDENDFCSEIHMLVKVNHYSEP